MSVPSANGHVQPVPSRNGDIRSVVLRSGGTAPPFASGFGAVSPDYPDRDHDPELEEARALLERYPAYTGTQFAAADFSERWFWEGLVMKGQPGLIAAQVKMMKTTLSAGLALRAALGLGAFAGRFPFATPDVGVRVMYLSGESGASSLRRMLGRQLREVQPQNETLPENLIIVPSCPRLDQHPRYLKLLLTQHRPELVFVDPVYRICGQQAVDVKDIAQAGETFGAVSEVVLEAGATPVFVDHNLRFRPYAKGDDLYSPPGLEDMKGGAAAYARQWILLGRREKFDASSDTVRLWVTTGGDGISDEFGIDIYEGPKDPRNRRRNGWQMHVLEPEQAREADRNRKVTRDIRAGDNKTTRFRELVMQLLREAPGQQLNQSQLHLKVQQTLGGYSKIKALTDALAPMSEGDRPIISINTAGPGNPVFYALLCTYRADPTPAGEGAVPRPRPSRRAGGL